MSILFVEVSQKNFDISFVPDTNAEFVMCECVSLLALAYDWDCFLMDVINVD